MILLKMPWKWRPLSWYSTLFAAEDNRTVCSPDSRHNWEERERERDREIKRKYFNGDTVVSDSFKELNRTKMFLIDACRPG